MFREGLGFIFMERRLRGVLSLADQNLASSNPVREKAIVDAHWVCFISLYSVLACRIMFITYSAWASGVARSTGKGNARAKVCGTSNQVQTLTLFSC